MDHRPQPYRRMLCRVPRLRGEERPSPACLQPDRKKSSFPCSLSREPKLPSCYFQVCAFALFLPRGKEIFSHNSSGTEIRRSDWRNIYGINYANNLAGLSNGSAVGEQVDEHEGQ